MSCRGPHKDCVTKLSLVTALTAAQAPAGPRCRNPKCNLPLKKDGACPRGCRQEPADLPARAPLPRHGAAVRRGALPASGHTTESAIGAARSAGPPQYQTSSAIALVQAIGRLPDHLQGMVTHYAPDQYEALGATVYLAADGQSGFAIKPDGELISVVSLAPGRGDGLVAAAVQQGASRLDCYEPYLPRLYARHGFREVQRYKWDDQYAPPNWDYERNGRPDVVVMERVAT